MKRLLIAILLTGPASAQVSTTCQRSGDQTYCNSYDNTPAANPIINQMLSNGASNGFQQSYQAAQARRAAQSTQSNDALERAKVRRAEAYDQVGALIAQGKCKEARNLADFYGKPDIVADTAKACPL